MNDAIRAELAEATTFDKNKVLRRNLDHIKLHAKQIEDRELIEDATIWQIRAERELGLMLAAAKAAGQITEGRVAKGSKVEPDPDRVTLKEIGVDKRLSAKAQKAAAMDDASFEQLEEKTRDKIKSGGAILVDPINAAAKDAELAGRRQAHAERTKDGGSIADLGRMVAEGRKFGSIGSDPQWKFLTRSAAGEGRSANIHYKTEEVDKIKDLPVGQLLADDGAFYMWMVDWCPQDALDLLAHWGLEHITTAFTWVKTNPNIGLEPVDDIFDNSTWHMGQGYWTRANPEQCWFATKADAKKKPKRLYADVRQLIVAPVMEHSRKPDEWLDRIERLTEGDYLELQARRTRRGWVSWGDELEFTGRAA
ncbi:MT-A70 family methyltransferase [Bradyrhizobium elkanii]|uniref:MT-A70 family methyltransferase n=1 Tax=Bradyrhizobium elkanii TaxID=29448 RepID=UPI00159EFD30|nr:MT-A70 family methyltransferase [Bradyrhizobium elkanii]